MKHRVITNSRELSCKLLIYCMKLGKSVLKLGRKLSMNWNGIPMAIPRRMNVKVWRGSGNITLVEWSLERGSGFINLLRVLWSVGGIKATMCMLCRSGPLFLTWGRCRR